MRSRDSREKKQQNRNYVVRKKNNSAEDFKLMDYKNPGLLRKFLSERDRIVSRKISGFTAKQQRALAVAIKRARFLGLLRYIPDLKINLNSVVK